MHGNNIVNNSVNAYVEHTSFFTPDMSEGDIGNGTDVVSWDNGLVGNYWSDYNGEGAYVIDKDNVDHYPLSEQVDISTSLREPEPFPTLLVVATIVTVAIVGIGLLIYFKKRKH